MKLGRQLKRAVGVLLVCVFLAGSGCVMAPPPAPVEQQPQAWSPPPQEPERIYVSAACVWITFDLAWNLMWLIAHAHR